MFELLKVDEYNENMWEENRLQRIYFMKLNKKNYSAIILVLTFKKVW